MKIGYSMCVGHVSTLKHIAWRHISCDRKLGVVLVRYGRDLIWKYITHDD